LQRLNSAHEVPAPMNPEDPREAHAIVRAYVSVLEQHFRADDPFPMPTSTLPYSKPAIKQSVRTVVDALTRTGQLSGELRALLETAYASLADYLDDDLVRVTREYRAALSDLEGDGRTAREKTDTPGWTRLADTSGLVGRIARAAADEADMLRAEFCTFGSRPADWIAPMS